MNDIKKEAMEIVQKFQNELISSDDISFIPSNTKLAQDLTKLSIERTIGVLEKLESEYDEVMERSQLASYLRLRIKLIHQRELLKEVTNL